MSQKMPLWIAVTVVILFVGVAVWGRIRHEQNVQNVISNFAECAAAGNPIMESYPEQCTTKDGRHFVNNIPQQESTEKEKIDTYLRENINTLSPVEPVLGGTWYVVSSTIDVKTNSGVVIYEDGHIQEERTFSYMVNENGDFVDFVILKNN